MVAKALARNNINHLIRGNCILVMFLGLHLYTTNGAPSQMWGCPQPGRKVVTYHQAWQIKGWSWLCCSSHCYTRSGILLTVRRVLKCGAHPGMPEMWQVHGGWHRYTRRTGRLSHQTSNLSCPCNLPPKGCDLCFAWYQVQGEKVVIYPATIKQLKSH